ncbi:MAG TPA: MFS transporter [Thermoplasmataceae archaeon]|nr:MFS transporter [Thermoplasmataceae archaeon]
MVISVAEEHETSQQSAVSDKYNGHAWFISYLLSNVSSGLTSPLIPLFVVVYLQSNVEFVGITSSIASAASVPALIFWGNLSDRIGRRKIFLIIGFLGSFLSLLLILVVNTLGMYILTLVIFQVVAMAATPVATLLILESTVEKKWPNVMASFNTISYIGLVAGLIAGTLILEVVGHGGRSVLPTLYLYSAIVYLAAAISAVFLLKEPERKLSRESHALSRVFSFRMVERNRFFPNAVIHTPRILKEKGKKLSPRTMKYIILTAFLMFGFQVFFVPFPVFVIDKLNGNETDIFVMYLLNNIASAVAFRVSGRSVNSLGLTKTMGIALFSRVAIIAAADVLSLLLMGFSFALWFAISLYGIMGFFWSFISVSWVTSISKLALPENRGKAIGYYNSFLGIGQIAGGLVSGIVSQVAGYNINFVVATVAVLGGALTILRYQSSITALNESGTRIRGIPH